MAKDQIELVKLGGERRFGFCYLSQRQKFLGSLILRMLPNLYL